MDPRLEVRSTPNAGNGVFAVGTIPADTLILTTSPPNFHVIYRAYRKEACGFCFKYNLGRNWKIKVSQTGFTFCSEKCRCEWDAEIGDVGRQAFEAVEALIKSSRGSKTIEKAEGNEDADEEDSPTLEDVKRAWVDAAPLAEQIQTARGSKPRAVFSLLSSIPVDGNTLAFILSGILSLHKWRSVDYVDLDGCGENGMGSAGGALSILYEAQLPYALKGQLAAYIHAYYQLLAVLPLKLLALVTPRNVQFIAGVAYDNAFGIRSVDHSTAQSQDALQNSPTHENPGSELLGWALYPEASLFNHSCNPSIKKARGGRFWRFWTSKDVEKGEELCITYLGGDEREMAFEARQERLRLGWEFQCGCIRCEAEKT